MANISESLAENLTGMRNTFTRTTKKDSEKKTSDIASEGFTGKDKKAGKASVTNAFYTTISEGQQKPLRVGDSIADVFAKIYNLLKMQYDEQKKRYELEQDAKKIGKIKQKAPEEKEVTEKAVKEDGKKEQQSLIKKIFGTILKGVTSAFSGILGIITETVGFLSHLVWNLIGLVGKVISHIPTIFAVIASVYTFVQNRVEDLISGLIKLSSKASKLTGGGAGGFVKGIGAGAIAENVVQYAVGAAVGKEEMTESAQKGLSEQSSMAALGVGIGALIAGIIGGPFGLLAMGGAALTGVGVGTILSSIARGRETISRSEKELLHGEEWADLDDKMYDILANEKGEVNRLLTVLQNMKSQEAIDRMSPGPAKDAANAKRQEVISQIKEKLDDLNVKSMEIQKKQEDADKKYKEERLDPVLKHLNYTREGDVIKNEKGEDLSVAEKIELYTKTHFSRAYLGVKQKEQELKDLAQRVREDVQTGLEYIEGLPQKAKDLGESISNKGKGIAEAISESIRILRSGDHEIPVIERTETKTVPIESGEKPPVKDESISMRSDDPTIMSIYKQNLRLV